LSSPPPFFALHVSSFPWIFFVFPEQKTRGDGLSFFFYFPVLIRFYVALLLPSGRFLPRLDLHSTPDSFFCSLSRNGGRSPPGVLVLKPSPVPQVYLSPPPLELKDSSPLPFLRDGPPSVSYHPPGSSGRFLFFRPAFPSLFFLNTTHADPRSVGLVFPRRMKECPSFPLPGQLSPFSFFVFTTGL